MKITPEMVNEGIREGFLVKDMEHPHFLLTRQELEGIVKRAYVAMRQLEPVETPPESGQVPPALPAPQPTESQT